MREIDKKIFSTAVLESKEFNINRSIVDTRPDIKKFQYFS